MFESVVFATVSWKLLGGYWTIHLFVIQPVVSGKAAAHDTEKPQQVVCGAVAQIIRLRVAILTVQIVIR